MYSDKLLLLKLDDIQEGLYRLQAFPIYRIVLLRTVRTHFLVCLGTFYYRR